MRGICHAGQRFVKKDEENKCAAPQGKKNLKKQIIIHKTISMLPIVVKKN
jgi:hypothetical protein